MKKKRRLTREGLTYHVNINKAHDVYGRNLLRSLEWMGVTARERRSAVLLARAARAREALPLALRAAGCTVDVAAYDDAVPPWSRWAPARHAGRLKMAQ